MMLGRVRASSLESLEMERSSPKIIKHDSLSIYEATLLKLKQGSHFNPGLRVEDSAIMDVCGTSATGSSEEEMNIDAECSSTNSAPTSTCSFQSTSSSSKEQSCKNMSIVDLFSKYKKSLQHVRKSIDREQIMENCSTSCPIFTLTPSS